MKMIFNYDANKIYFHNKGFALSLVLKVRFFGTRKWPIIYESSGWSSGWSFCFCFDFPSKVSEMKALDRYRQLRLFSDTILAYERYHSVKP